MSELNIYQRINAIMRDCDYLQKKAAQQGKGIKYDEVIAMLREHLINHGVVMVIRQLSMECLAGVEGTKQKIYQGHYEMQLVNMDKPEEIVVHTVFAQGMDGGDKGPGKASTYAMKTMLVKGFGIETGEDEESRSEKIENEKVINEEQAEELKTLLQETESDVKAFCKNFGCASVDSLLALSYKRALAMVKAKQKGAK